MPVFDYVMIIMSYSEILFFFLVIMPPSALDLLSEFTLVPLIIYPYI